MKKLVTCGFLLLLIYRSPILYAAINQSEKKIESVEFTIIGGGGAGILVVGILLDLGVDPRKIVWIDPEFKVGRLGEFYQNVPANAKTKMFIEFIKACKTFGKCSAPSIDRLFSLELDKEYELKFIVEPLQDITHYLRKKVPSLLDYLTDLYFDTTNKVWMVILQSGKHVVTNNVVLATGSHPRTLNYEECKNEIPLDEAIDCYKLASHVTDQDTVAVIGSAHSAILLLKYLSELPVARVVNFYTKPIVYPLQMDGWVLYDNTGLMGATARWAKEVLEKNPPAKILRILSTEEIIKTWLPICSKVIYAAGFERNQLPDIPGISYDNYNKQTGAIGTGLFGIGIAFPEVYTDPLGNVEKAVGLPDFMEYALRIVPTWIQRDASISYLEQFAELFSIVLL